MNKTLVIAAAMAAGVAVADVTSQNCVGYNTLNNGDQSVMLGCQFVDVADGESGILLGNIKGEFEDNDELQLTSCDEVGAISSVSFFYFTEASGMGWDGDGWYSSESGMKANDDTEIAHSTAMWFTGASAAKPATISGQVYNGNYTHTFSALTEMVCSAFPVPFNPNDTEKVQWTGLTDNDEIQVTSCDETGAISSVSYFWFTEESGMGWDGDGWYSSESGLKTDEPVVVAGQGFWLTLADPANVTMVETCPIK